MSKLLKIIGGAAVLVLVSLCFATGLLIERQPAVGPAPIPQAEDVRRAVLLAQSAQQLIQVSTPVDVTLPADGFEAVHRLVDYAKDNLGADAIIDGNGVAFRLSKRMMKRGWLNIGVRLDEAPTGGAPNLSLTVGPWRVPDALVARVLRTGLPLLKGDGPPPASLDDLIPRFRVDGNAIAMTARIPKPFVGALQAMLSPGPGTIVDMARVRDYYGDLLRYSISSAEQRYPRLVRHVAENVDDEEDLKAAVVALTMYVDGPRVRRLGGERSPTPPCVLPAQPAFLHGRDDLPKHWTISAALALFVNQRMARAVGLWKELDDSLPGGDGLAAGSGFSFVDLAADTGGVAVGMVARGGPGFDAAVKALRSGRDDVILPREILQLPEGVPLARFKRDYGGLEQPRMVAAETRIKALLGRSPLYRTLPAD